MDEEFFYTNQFLKYWNKYLQVIVLFFLCILKNRKKMEEYIYNYKLHVHVNNSIVL